MLKGDMCLKVVEQGKHRDVPIKQGEVTTEREREREGGREGERVTEWLTRHVNFCIPG